MVSLLGKKGDNDDLEKRFVNTNVDENETDINTNHMNADPKTDDSD